MLIKRFDVSLNLLIDKRFQPSSADSLSSPWSFVIKELTNVRRPSRSLANCSLASGGCEARSFAARCWSGIIASRKVAISFLENPGV